MVALLVLSGVVESGRQPVLRIVGLIALLSSPLLFLPPFWALRKWGDTAVDQSYMVTQAVVTRGPYRFVRHPQYVGYMLLAAGFALLKQHWAITLLAPLVLGLFVALAMQEEKVLRARFGQSYTAYCQRVPRFNVALGLIRWIRLRRH